MDSSNLIILIVALLVIIVALFLLFRSFVLWYYKIDIRINQNDQIITLLKQISTPLKEDSIETFLKDSPNKDADKSKKEESYFSYNKEKKKLIKGFRYLTSSVSGISSHELILIDTDEITFDIDSGQFCDYQGDVGFLMFHIESTSHRIIYDGRYSSEKKNVSAELILNQNINSEKIDSIKFSSVEIELKEWDDDYEISFNGVLESNERIEGKYFGKIEHLPELKDW